MISPLLSATRVNTLKPHESQSARSAQRRKRNHSEMRSIRMFGDHPLLTVWVDDATTSASLTTLRDTHASKYLRPKMKPSRLTSPSQHGLKHSTAYASNVCVQIAVVSF